MIYKKYIELCCGIFLLRVYFFKSFSVFENMRRTFGCAPLKKCAWCGITIECSLWHLRSVLKFELWTLKCYNIPLNCTRSIGERQRKEIKFWFFSSYICNVILPLVTWAEFTPVLFISGQSSSWGLLKLQPQGDLSQNNFLSQFLLNPTSMWLLHALTPKRII